MGTMAKGPAAAEEDSLLLPAAALSSSPAVVAPAKGAAAPAPQAAVVARSWAGPATAHAVKPKIAAPVEKPRPPGEVIRVPIDGAIEVADVPTLWGERLVALLGVEPGHDGLLVDPLLVALH